MLLNTLAGNQLTCPTPNLPVSLLNVTSTIISFSIYFKWKLRCQSIKLPARFSGLLFVTTKVPLAAWKIAVKQKTNIALRSASIAPFCKPIYLLARAPLSDLPPFTGYVQNRTVREYNNWKAIVDKRRSKNENKINESKTTARFPFVSRVRFN